MQALLITAAGSVADSHGRANEHLSQRNAKEQQPLEIALQGKQWYAVQLLVTAGMTCFHETTRRYRSSLDAVLSTVSQHGIAAGLAAAYSTVTTSCVWKVFDVTMIRGTN